MYFILVHYVHTYIINNLEKLIIQILKNLGFIINREFFYTPICIIHYYYYSNYRCYIIQIV